MSAEPIPKLSTREEEAAFWDTHDFTDYWDELEPANLKPEPNLASSILVPMDGESLTQICQRAKESGTDVSTLARTWLLERLQALTTD